GAAPMSGGELHAQARTAIPARFAEAFGDWTPQAVVFDCDGLLLDTESVWQTAEDRVVAAHDAVLREGDAALLHGSTIEVAAGRRVEVLPGLARGHAARRRAPRALHGAGGLGHGRPPQTRPRHVCRRRPGPRRRARAGARPRGLRHRCDGGPGRRAAADRCTRRRAPGPSCGPRTPGPHRSRPPALNRSSGTTGRLLTRISTGGGG